MRRHRATGAGGGVHAEGKTHHVDENDLVRMNLALDNAQNVTRYYEENGDEVVIEIVAYGPACTCCAPTHHR